MAERERRPGRQPTYGVSHDEAEQVMSEHGDVYAAPGPRMVYTGAIPPVQEEWVDADKRPPTASERFYGDARGNKASRHAIGPGAGEGAQAGETAAEDRERKYVLLDQAKDFALLSFADIRDAGSDSIREIGNSPELPKTDLGGKLIGLAASTLLGASSGAAATWLLGSITTAGVAGKAAATISGLLGGAVQKALETDHASAAASVTKALDAFAAAFTIQLMAARQEFVAGWEGVRAALSILSVDQLATINELRASRDPKSFHAEMRRHTYIAWTNFLARMKHGAMGAWDFWEQDGSRDAIALPGAAPKPVAGGLDPARNNIAPDANSPLLEIIQRPMQDEVFGVLEIFVDANGRIIDRPGYRMRLDHVSPQVRDEFRAMGKVRELKVNKVVHMCSSLHHGVRVDPPTSIASVLITADGYVRASNWSEFLRVHFEPRKGPPWDPAGFGDCMDQTIQGKETADCYIDRKAKAKEVSAFAAAAQELPLSWLEG